MNRFVADPEWGWWIVFYFFLGGIAAGAYFLSALIELVGRPADRNFARMGYLIAFPLIIICAVLLMVDLTKPDRFWHMLFHSEVVADAMHEGWPSSADGWKRMVHAPLIKYWSPMSVGSWAISLFGLCSFISFVASIRPRGFMGRLHGTRLLGHPLRFIGCAVGFFVAAYTGALMTATNQPIWSDTVWIAPLFLTSAASSGMAAMILLGLRRANSQTRVRLGRADLWFLGLELIIFMVFLASLGALLLPLLDSLAGKVLIVGTLFCGLLIPLAIHLRLGLLDTPGAMTTAIFVLMGAFLLRWALVTSPPELLSGSSFATSVEKELFTDFGPEAGRVRGGGRGADPGNRRAEFQPRSKVFDR